MDFLDDLEVSFDDNFSNDFNLGLSLDDDDDSFNLGVGLEPKKKFPEFSGKFFDDDLVEVPGQDNGFFSPPDFPQVDSLTNSDQLLPQVQFSPQFANEPFPTYREENLSMHIERPRNLGSVSIQKKTVTVTGKKRKRGKGGKKATFDWHSDFEAEKKKTLSELKRPTVADLEDECETKDVWLNRLDLEEEYRNIIRKYEGKVGVASN